MAARTPQSGSGVKEAWGILLLALCLLICLSLFSYDWRDIRLLKVPPNSPPYNFIGPFGAWLSFFLFVFFGVGAYLVPIWCLGLGLLFIFGSRRPLWPKATWSAVIMFSLSGLLDLQHEWWQPVGDKLNIDAATGGVVAQFLVQWLSADLLGEVGAAILISAIFLTAVVMLFGVEAAKNALLQFGTLCIYLYQRARRYFLERRDQRSTLDREERQVIRQRKRLEHVVETDERLAAALIRETEEEIEKQRKESITAETEEAKVERPAPPPAPAAAVPAPRRPRAEPKPRPPTSDPDYRLPGLDLLDKPAPGKDRAIRSDVQTTGHVIQETLSEFGIETEIMNAEQGPVVTRYELKPAPGVRVERIAGLSNNLALSLKATSVRVQAPIPGKGVVGVEVPNSTASAVYLRELLEGETWRLSAAELPLVLGKDVGGNDIVADLATMPHLLIAGATGSGKTVCMNSLLAGLLLSRKPSELRLMLIDPKIVEFTPYAHLPHLVVPVITDPKKVSLGLRWAINEMEKRYKVFAKAGVRNISTYNKRPKVKQSELFGEMQDPAAEPAEPDILPYIVIVIDELADLMLVAQAEIENAIARLAQLSRAVGIHMILATQRPSVNVITGTIKANFPARIAFQVAQKVDSRTILDANGADKLLGRGDMLFLPPGSSKLVRAQGALTTDGEINRIVQFIRDQAEPNYEVAIKEKMESPTAAIEGEEEDDQLLEASIQIIKETHRASTSSLQRRLRIGYTRAARIMDLLEQRGVVGPPRGSDPREILIDLDGDIPDNPAQSEGEQQ